MVDSASLSSREANSRDTPLRLWCPIPTEHNPLGPEVEERTAAWIRRHRLDETSDQDRALSVWICRCTAMFYPDAPLEQLQIASDFNTWVFAFDDYVDLPGGAGDAAKATVRLARLVRLAEAPEAVPLDGSPLGVALADLVARLSRCATSSQLARFAESLRRGMFCWAWERSLLEDGEEHDLNEYATLRLGATFIPAYAALCEIMHGYRLDGEELATPPARALTEMACLLVGLHNDVYSWAKEEASHAPGINAVTVLARETDGDLQEALARALALSNQVMALFVRLRDHTQEQASDGLRHYLRDLGRLIAGTLEFCLHMPHYRRGLKPEHRELLERIWVDTTSADVAPGPPPALASIAWWWQQLPETAAPTAPPAQPRVRRHRC
ncbi:terpene synthase family protein [Streptomyces chartreusis]|uniref:terpene synthase family protein n=1 Tax=Streptomyces chartreusis TaxID=1969 RepID=UPI002E17F134